MIANYGIVTGPRLIFEFRVSNATPKALVMKDVYHMPLIKFFITSVISTKPIVPCSEDNGHNTLLEHRAQVVADHYVIT